MLLSLNLDLGQFHKDLEEVQSRKEVQMLLSLDSDLVPVCKDLEEV
jgi:hypothetical protein